MSQRADCHPRDERNANAPENARSLKRVIERRTRLVLELYNTTLCHDVGPRKRYKASGEPTSTHVTHRVDVVTAKSCGSACAKWMQDTAPYCPHTPHTSPHEVTSLPVPTSVKDTHVFCHDWVLELLPVSSWVSGTRGGCAPTTRTEHCEQSAKHRGTPLRVELPITFWVVGYILGWIPLHPHALVLLRHGYRKRSRPAANRWRDASSNNIHSMTIHITVPDCTTSAGCLRTPQAEVLVWLCWMRLLVMRRSGGGSCSCQWRMYLPS